MSIIRIASSIAAMMLLVSCLDKAGLTGTHRKSAAIDEEAGVPQDGEALPTNSKPLPDPMSEGSTPGSDTTSDSGSDGTANNQPAPSETTPEANYCYKATQEICQIEAVIIRETNRYREEVGVAPLKYSTKISFVARDWSTDQGEAGDISHTGFPSARLTALIEEFGAKPSSKLFAMSGENVALNTKKSTSTPEQIGVAIAQQWRNSSGHYKNMIKSSYTAIGVGIAVVGKTVYATQIFGKDSEALPPPL